MGARIFHACLSLQMARPPSQVRIQLELLPSSRQQRKSLSLLPSLRQVTVGQVHSMDEDKCETRLYIGNLDLRITGSHLINMFSPFGKIVVEDFYTRGPKRGEPRGFAFIQFSTKEEAKLAKETMNGRLAFGHPLVVRLAAEKYLIKAANPPQAVGDSRKSTVTSGSSGQMNRSTKITTIKNKLKALEEESSSSKRPRQSDHAS